MYCSAPIHILFLFCLLRITKWFIFPFIFADIVGSFIIWEDFGSDIKVYKMDYGSFLCDFFLTIYWFIIPATMVKGCRYNLFVQFTISLSNGFTSYFHRMKINYEIKFEWRQRNERMKKRVYEWMMRSNTKNIIWCVKKAIWTSYTVCSYCFLNNPWFRASMLTISETTGTNLNNCSLFSHTHKQ